MDGPVDVESEGDGGGQMSALHPAHPDSINRFDAFGDYEYIDTSPSQLEQSDWSLRWADPSTRESTCFNSCCTVHKNGTL